MSFRDIITMDSDVLDELSPMKELPESVTLDNANSIQDKLTSLKWIPRSFELRLLGYEWDSNGKNFVYKGSCLTGSETASKGAGLLEPFASEINLMSQKDFQKWVDQRFEVASTFNEWVFNSADVPAKNQKTVLKMFRNTLQNMADVSLHSKSTMKLMFGQEEKPLSGGSIIN